jgi:hypothetical protein
VTSQDLVLFVNGTLMRGLALHTNLAARVRWNNA